MNHWAKKANSTLVSVDFTSFSRRNSAVTSASLGRPTWVAAVTAPRWRPVQRRSVRPRHVV